VTPTCLGCVVIEPTTYVDGRGYFLETFNRDRFAAAELPTELVHHGTF